MERALRKPVAFILTLALLFGTFCIPSFGEEQSSTSLYNEASITNGIDTGFEKQNEIAEVKAQSYDGTRTLSTDSHSGRFSLKIGKTGMTNSAICHIINSGIDLTKYNKVSMWVKPKGYNIPLTLYTQVGGQSTTIGSIEVASLKADVWQEVSFDLSSISVNSITGIYTYAYNNKSLLIDDIKFTKTYANTETWDLNTSGSNTLPTVMSYQNNVGVTLKTSSTSSAAYESGAKVASIENFVSGQISDIQIDSSSLKGQSNLASTSSAMYVDYILSNSALYTVSKDCNMIYYYDKNSNSVKVNNQTTNATRKIFDGPVKMMKTNDDGSSLVFQSSDDNTLYLVKSALTTNLTNVTGQSIKLTDGVISNINFRGDDLYFVSNDMLYVSKAENSYKPEKISDYYYYEMNYKEPSNVSLVQDGSYRYYYFSDYNRGGYYRIYRHDNFIQTNPDKLVFEREMRGSDYSSRVGRIVDTNQTGSNILFKINSNYDGLNHYIITNADTNNPVVVSVGNPSNYYFCGDYFLYNTNNKLPNFKSVNELNYSLSINKNGESIIFIKDYSSIYQINKTFGYDKELLYQFTPSGSFSTKPSSNAAIVSAKFSTLPNQVITQMENGDIYSIDTRTKTNRLLINNMVLYDVLDQGRLLLSDMKDTGRFLIYDPTSNGKDVFRLDNRSTGPAFTVQFNDTAKTVYYLNKENKMQVLPLIGAETKDKYALMLNNDNKWWVYKNNAWKTIYTGSDTPSVELMDSMGMTATEVNAITEKEFLKLPENAKPETLRIAVYFNTNSPYASPLLKSIQVTTKDAEADLEGKTAYGTRIKEYNKADFREVSAIHVTENKDSTDEILYFLVANDTPYSIRNGEVCNIDKSATQLFSNVKENYMDIMTYGMSAKELAAFPSDSLKKILITDNTTDKFGIVAVIKTMNKDTKEVKLDYALESLQKRFEDSVTTVKIILTDDTLIQYTSGEVSKEEIEKFADWVMDRKYNRGPVFFTFHVGNQYKVINYYMIKMFSVE